MLTRILNCKVAKFVKFICAEILNGARSICTSTVVATKQFWGLNWKVKVAILAASVVLCYYFPIVSLFVGSTILSFCGSHPVINELVGWAFIIAFYFILAYTSLILLPFVILSLSDLWQYFERKYYQE